MPITEPAGAVDAIEQLPPQEAAIDDIAVDPDPTTDVITVRGDPVTPGSVAVIAGLNVVWAAAEAAMTAKTMA